MTARILEAFINGRLAGRLVENRDVWGFVYAQDWISDPHAFPLAPGIPLARRRHIDGSTHRSIQWFFDNLLPEEALRSAISRELEVDEHDAFGLLQALGAESAGSLVLLPPGAGAAERGARTLELGELAHRVRNLPRVSLNAGSPKRMSLAGAQHKMVVLYDEKTARLQEPLQGTASSHILKPDSTAEGYPHSVINEAFTMLLAGRLGMNVPAVHLLYTPEPVYVIRRFDRSFDATVQEWQRLHVVDACQLLDLARTFKYQSASLQTLASLIDRCREKAQARMGLYQWMLFNTLVGNSDSHLKNLSFLLDRGGVRLAPFYDLLSTAVYRTVAYADEHAVWPQERLTVPLAGAVFFADVTYDKLLAVGMALGLTEGSSRRILDRMLDALAPQADALIAEFEAGQLHQPAGSAIDHATRSAHLRVLRSIRHIVIEDMLALVRKTRQRGAGPGKRRRPA